MDGSLQMGFRQQPSWHADAVRGAVHPIIPNKSNRKRRFPFDQALYQLRNIIERTFCRLKDFRAIATRYDKTARNFLAGLCLVAALCYWVN